MSSSSHFTRFVIPLLLIGPVLLTQCAKGLYGQVEQDPAKLKKDYDQWKMAQEKSGLADPKSIAVPPGFEVELVKVSDNEGSWINLAFDPKGRLVICREDKGLIRLTMSDDFTEVKKVETIEDSLLECRGILFAQDSLYLAANNTKGIYRLRDTDNDDQYDSKELLIQLEGGVGHGRNCLALGPDGKIYVACGNNVQVPPSQSKLSPYRNYGLDRLIPCVWNEFLFDADVVPPAGFILRADKDGKDWELYAGGFRNEYGVAFNQDGELFTYDADMEWDEGAPWYRTTCLMHVTQGGEYGWRQGSSVWPASFMDSNPRVVDVGLGSPTAIQFGYKSNFPKRYRDQLYILDWSYGRILGIELTPTGSTYSAQMQTFVKGKPLNVTGIEFGPDGSMYFTVGGRRTQSALYRVKYVGKGEDGNELSQPEGSLDEFAKTRAIRHAIESLQSEAHPDQLPRLIEWLGHDDRLICNSARVALEQIPVEQWISELDGKGTPLAKLNLGMAWARVGKNHEREKVLSTLVSLLSQPRTLTERLTGWRAWQLIMIRQGALSSEEKSGLQRLLLEAYPSDSSDENYLMCELLSTLGASESIDKSLELIQNGKTQEEKLAYLYALRVIKEGWTIQQRERLLDALKEAESFTGAQYIQRFVAFIRSDFINQMSSAEKQQLAAKMKSLGEQSVGAVEANKHEFVKSWTVDELQELLSQVSADRDLVRGKQLFVDASCAHCHRRGGVGRALGPDLDSASDKFTRKDMLETIMVPSKVVEEKYKLTMIETDDGQVVTGELVGGDETTLSIAPDPRQPFQVVQVKRSGISSRKLSQTSMMPEGLLNSFTKEEIIDLLSYIEFGEKSVRP